MGLISAIAPSEQARLDLEKLEGIFGRLGIAEAEDMVCRAIEELALRMGRIEDVYRSGQRVEMRKNTQALALIADQVGMSLLSRIAEDVVACIDDCDQVALSATFARLARVCEMSLMRISDLQEI